VLLPVCERHRGDTDTAELLAGWRNQNLDAFPEGDPVTPGNGRWLGTILDTPDRVLFLVADKRGAWSVIDYAN
jgi:hypothetical protein